MSEYQFYEFRALDKPLDQRAQTALRALSSRAEITPDGFTVTYTRGDLRGDPLVLLERWFDAFLYVTNWGTRWLGFRFPAGVLVEQDISAYAGEFLELREKKRRATLVFLIQDDDPEEDPVDVDEWLDALLPLRDALASGDRRALYLTWLLALQHGHVEPEEVEPPVPGGLAELDAALRAFVEVTGLESDLLAVAAESRGEDAARRAGSELLDLADARGLE